MSVYLFEDERAVELYPISISKPIFTIHCGSYSLAEIVEFWGVPISCWVRPHLRAVLRADQEQWFGTARLPAPVLLLNAATVPAVDLLEKVRKLYERGKAGVVRTNGRLAAALLPAGVNPPSADSSAEEFAAFVKDLNLPPLELEVPLVEYPHDLIRHHVAALRVNLQDRLARGSYREVADGVFVAGEAELGQYLVTDSRTGPILIENGARIGPHCYINGPAYIGQGARVIEHSAIKDGVSLGHTTKIGGEVEASIIEAYTNKQHHGFLGHSYLGSWINLGAGTCNSDLKNTYGQVNMEYYGRKVATGMQFIGTIVGDYAKSAINTGIFTGKTVGACSMVYGFVTTNVPSFVNYARLFGQVTETPADVMIATQGRMFARRNVTQRPCDAQLLRDMYELSRHERQMAGEPLSL